MKKVSRDDEIAFYGSKNKNAADDDDSTQKKIIYNLLYIIKIATVVGRELLVGLSSDATTSRYSAGGASLSQCIKRTCFEI